MSPTKTPSASAPVEALRLDRQLCFALYGAANRVTRLYRPLLDALGLTYSQYLAMLVLWEASPRTVGSAVASDAFFPKADRSMSADEVLQSLRNAADFDLLLLDMTHANFAQAHSPLSPMGLRQVFRKTMH